MRFFRKINHTHIEKADLKNIKKKNCTYQQKKNKRKLRQY